LTSRRGDTLVEFALVAPVVFLLIFGLLIGGMGVSRYQQLAYLAREASRYASVHGSQYATDTGNPAATSTDIYNRVIVPRAVGLDLSRLTYSITWNTSNAQYHPVGAGKVANTVTVALTYVWIPGMYVPQKTMRSTSVSVMSF
jgi:Flp pilus assembly protein TadG